MDYIRPNLQTKTFTLIPVVLKLFIWLHKKLPLNPNSALVASYKYSHSSVYKR